MAGNKGKESEKESAKRQFYGSYISGKFYCECNLAASCQTTTQGPNRKRKFYTCSKSKKLQCGTFIWTDEEEDAKAYFEQHGPPPQPLLPGQQTPRRGSMNRDPSSEKIKNLETPFTKAKRKPVSREVSDETAEEMKLRGESSKRDGFEGFVDIDADLDVGMETPLRKVAKRLRFSTPRGVDVKEKSEEAKKPIAAGIPTPVSEIPSKRSSSRQRSISSSPSALKDKGKEKEKVPQEPIVIEDEKASDLSSTVLRLLRTEGAQIKGSLELQIRHEIELEMDSHEAKIRRYKKTIDGLSKRVDELENMVGLLTGDGGAGGEDFEFVDMSN